MWLLIACAPAVVVEESLSLVDTVPAAESVGVSADAVFVATFSHPLLPTTVSESTLTITDAVGEVPVLLEVLEEVHLRATPRDLLAEDSEITVTIDGQLAGRSAAALGTDVVVRFQTAAP